MVKVDKTGLRYQSDYQSLLYLLCYPLLIAWQWYFGVSIVLYGLTLFLSLGVGVIHHNHAHLPIFYSKNLNKTMGMVLTLLQSHPTSVFYCTHNANHHRFHHGPGDLTRTYRFHFGDSNHFLGYLLHPFEAVRLIYPYYLSWLQAKHRKYISRISALQVFLIALVHAALFTLDAEKWFILLAVPQLHGLHWLLATNYLQHAHADGNSKTDFARNFEGGVNALLFNIGLHTPHHLYPHLHWSLLRGKYEEMSSSIHPQLREPSLARYMFRTFFLSLFSRRWKSSSLMHHAHSL